MTICQRNVFWSHSLFFRNGYTICNRWKSNGRFQIDSVGIGVSIQRRNCSQSVDIERICCRCLPRWAFSSPRLPGVSIGFTLSSLIICLLHFCHFTRLRYTYIYFLELYSLYDENNQEVKDQSFTLSNSFFDSSMLPQSGFIDNAIRGLTKQLPSSVDVEYTSELTNLLLKE